MATTLGQTRLFRPFVAALAVGLMAGLAAAGARAGDWMPLLPDQDFYDFQLFAPPDLQEYEIYKEAPEGVFFSYDRLYWAITPPSVSGVGRTQTGGYIIPSSPIAPETIVQLNNASLQTSGSQSVNVIGGVFIFGGDPLQLDLNTSWMRTAMTWGNRYEGGWIYDDRGIELGYFDTGNQQQSFSTLSEFAASSPTQIFTQTATGGGLSGGGGGVGNVNQALITTTITSNSPPPDHIIAQKLTQDNYTRMQSAAAAFIIRRTLGRRGSGTTLRFGCGPRFLQFEDRFTLGYESNQYAFNRGPLAGGNFSGVNIGAQQGGGNLGGLGQGGGAQGGTQGGGTAGGTGATGFGNTGSTNVVLAQSSAGDVLGITGNDTLTGRGPGSPLQTGQWQTSSYNNMVGPEISLLLESTQGRWTFLSELKFTAGLNWQNMLYNGANLPNSIGADYLRTTFNPSVTNVSTGGGSDIGNTVQLQPPPLFLQIYGIGQQNATNAAKHTFVFTPIGEWRLGGEFRVSQAITLRGGYTGVALGNVARASSNTGYKSVPQSTRYAEALNPLEQASTTNPWVVKSTGAVPTGAVPVPGVPNTFKDANGTYYTGIASPYHRDDPVYNRIAPVGTAVQDYVFTNGVDFGIEVRY